MYHNINNNSIGTYHTCFGIKYTILYLTYLYQTYCLTLCRCSKNVGVVYSTRIYFHDHWETSLGYQPILIVTLLLTINNNTIISSVALAFVCISYANKLLDKRTTVIARTYIPYTVIPGKKMNSVNK